MSTLSKAGLVFIGCLLSFVANGQEGRVGALGALPMQYNSSFAGETGSPRLNTVAGLWSRQYSRSYWMYAAYDQFIPALRSGIGITAGHGRGSNQGTMFDSEYRNKSQGTYLSLAIAPKFSAGGKVTLSPSLDVWLTGGRSAYTLAGVDYQRRNIGVGSRAGLLLNTEKFYAGYSVHLVNYFNFSAEDDTTSSCTSGRAKAFTSYWQLGYTFGRGSGSGFSFTPQLVFHTGTNRDPYASRAQRVRALILPVDFNFGFRYKKIIWGLNRTGVHVGWQTDKLRIMLSDNLQYTSRYDPGYEANLSLRYIFKE